MLRWKLFRSRWFALAWFIMTCVLFFLPGSDLPHDQWLSDLHFDKLVHIGLFAGLIFLCRSAFNLRWHYYHALLLSAALAYGYLVEVIQREWIPNRSFDLYDVLADMAGSVLGLVVWLWVYKKNKPL